MLISSIISRSIAKLYSADGFNITKDLKVAITNISLSGKIYSGHKCGMQMARFSIDLYTFELLVAARLVAPCWP